MLLKLGANALIAENAGRTARKCAEKQNHRKLSKLLREAEAAQREEAESDAKPRIGSG